MMLCVVMSIQKCLDIEIKIKLSRRDDIISPVRIIQRDIIHGSIKPIGLTQPYD